MYEYGIGIVSL